MLSAESRQNLMRAAKRAATTAFVGGEMSVTEARKK
jgi:hypothetical protein